MSENTGLSFDAIITEEVNGDRKIYNATCEELGITDFGYTPQEAIENLKKGLELLFEVDPSKKELLLRERPVTIKKIFL